MRNVEECKTIEDDDTLSAWHNTKYRAGVAFQHFETVTSFIPHTNGFVGGCGPYIIIGEAQLSDSVIVPSESL